MMMTSAFSFAQLSAVDYSDNNQKLSGYVGKPKKALKNTAGVLIYLHGWE